MKKYCFGLLAAFVLLSGCSVNSVENATDEFLTAKKLAKLKSNKLEEISGIVASEKNPGMLWVHNDSGNKPEIYLVDQELKILLTVKLKNAQNRDWEDIAIGPGPEAGKTYLYVGDIGDNFGQFPDKYIYRFEEPAASEDEKEISLQNYDRIIFTLPDANKDTETLLVDPTSKDIFVISKREEPVWVYKIAYPYQVSDTIRAEKLFSLPLTQIVGGDISPDGKKILLKNYEHIYYWPNPGVKTIEESLKEKPFEVPYKPEPQGESITWGRAESGFYTISEKNVGKDSYLYFYESGKKKR